MKHDLDLRLVVDATPTLIFSARPNRYIDYMNRRWLDLVGAPAEGVECWGTSDTGWAWCRWASAC